MSYMERLAKSFVFVLAVLVLSFQSSLLAQEYKKKDVDKNKSGDNRDNAFQKTAKDLTLKLSQKVNLSEDQSKKVSDILVGLQKDVADKESGNKSGAVGSNDSKDKLRDADITANDKIEKIITDKDIPAYMKVKKEWWSKIKDKVYSENFAVNEDQSQSKTTAKERKAKKDSRSEAVGSSRTDNNTAGSEDKDKNNPQFEQFAKDMSVSLMKKLDLSLEKAADIEDVLIDYQKNIADAQKKIIDENRSNVADNTGAVKSRNERNRNMENVGSSERSASSNEMQSAIRSADDKIVDVLNDNQKPKYDKVKKQWWKDVQSRISSNIRHYERTGK